MLGLILVQALHAGFHLLEAPHILEDQAHHQGPNFHETSDENGESHKDCLVCKFNSGHHLNLAKDSNGVAGSPSTGLQANTDHDPVLAVALVGHPLRGPPVCV